MDYSAKIASVRARIEELRKIKDILFDIEDTVCAIEKEVSDTDKSLPPDEEIAAMPGGEEKEQIRHLIDLDNQAFALIDEILGPPEDEMTGMPQGTAFSPVARGNGTVSLDEALSRMLADSSKKSAS